MNNASDSVRVIPSLVALSTYAANPILPSVNKIYRHKLKTNRPIKSKGFGLSLFFFNMNPILIQTTFLCETEIGVAGFVPSPTVVR